MSSKIHPTALVSPKARIDPSVEIGPYAIIEENVSIGAGTRVGPHCVFNGYTEIGKNNRIGVGAVIGLEPQDLAYKGEKSFVKVGDNNDIREYVQIHRGTKEGTVTTVGNNNFFLGFSHVAHNCAVGNNVIVANGALLAGYVEVQDFAFVSGHCLVHQFTRIGKYAMMRGGSRISLDLPPYCIADDANQIRGINVVGLERRGFTTDQMRAIKRVYKDLFMGENPLNQTVDEMLAQDILPEVRFFLEFIKSAHRGICRPAA